jgi:hypothetical protein
MRKRRPLTDGIKKTKAEAGQLASGRKQNRPKAIESKADEETPEPIMAHPLGRTPLSTRIRSDFGFALKQASLKRELAGQEPHAIQDILEEALEPWLKSHGYLP